MKNPRRALTGWGRSNATVSEVAEVPNHEIPAALQGVGPRGALARGLGRSYGDAAQNGGGLVVRPLGAAHQAVIDPAQGTVTVPAGVSIDDLLRVLVPRGWFVPVTPGTRFVTIGGAIASDIHGKNHHVDGSIGNHVRSLTLLMADGSQRVLGPQQQPELFWATVGGMGLTGIILEATIGLLPVETSAMSVDTTRIPDLDTLFAAMSTTDEQYRYSVAWIDLLAKGAHLGRSVLTCGDHAPLAQLHAAAPGTTVDPDAALAFGPKQLVAVPPVPIPSRLLNKLTVAAFNELWFRKAPRERKGELQGISAFFHPLDFVGSWNRLYGQAGLIQYQFVVPFGQEATMRQVIERLSAAGAASFLAVLKRLGPGNPAPLSFPREGWTLALDLPGGGAGLAELFTDLDRMVLDAGGRHYAAKDALTTPEAMRRGYPRLAEWQAVRSQADPHGMWQSDLARRLHLLDTPEQTA
ncbi:MAG: FAD-binding oxidoreductase [Actinomycetota bacterium]|nr:FAD-binding oxidoreductase [Actinomycetota bacterium]